jgi:hypothetical protein
MVVAEPLPLFGFERDLYPSLHCIPMAARYKLDQVGVKVPLKAWNRMPLERRRALLCEDGVETAAERERLRAELCAWLRQVSDEPVRFLPLEELPAWEDTNRLAPAVAEQGTACQPPLLVTEWAALPRLQRFALVKLATTKHERGRFAAALAEFRTAATRR